MHTVKSTILRKNTAEHGCYEYNIGLEVMLPIRPWHTIFDSHDTQVINHQRTDEACSQTSPALSGDVPGSSRTGYRTWGYLSSSCGTPSWEGVVPTRDVSKFHNKLISCRGQMGNVPYGSYGSTAPSTLSPHLCQ